MPPRDQLSHENYRTLAKFRHLLRQFLEFSQEAAAKGGLTSRQHQAVLAIKSFPQDHLPTIGDLAEQLYIQHHSAVELVDRLVEAGLIRRQGDASDRRRVRLGLTASAERSLAGLSATHLEELRRLRPALLQILDQIGTDERESPDAG